MVEQSRLFIAWRLKSCPSDIPHGIATLWSWENHGKNHGKTMGKPWELENSWDFYDPSMIFPCFFPWFSHVFSHGFSMIPHGFSHWNALTASEIPEATRQEGQRRPLWWKFHGIMVRNMGSNAINYPITNYLEVVLNNPNMGFSENRLNP